MRSSPGASTRCAARRKGSPARPRCISATATASRRKQSLGAEWRQYERIFPALAASRIDQVSLECANSHVPLELLSLLGDKDVLVGAIDVASTEAETPEQVAAYGRSGHALRAGGAALSLHQLRDGDLGPHPRPTEARRARRRRRARPRPATLASVCP